MFLSCVMWLIDWLIDVLFGMELHWKSALHMNRSQDRERGHCWVWEMLSGAHKEQVEAAGSSTPFLRLFIVCSQLNDAALCTSGCSCRGAGLGCQGHPEEWGAGRASTAGQGFSAWATKVQRDHKYKDTASGFLPLHSYKLQIWTSAEQARLSLLQLVRWWACR